MRISMVHAPTHMMCYGCAHVGTYAFGRRHTYTYKHQKGWCVFHLGRKRHGADDITTGERLNLILWNHSSTYRASEDPVQMRASFSSAAAVATARLPAKRTSARVGGRYQRRRRSTRTRRTSRRWGSRTRSRAEGKTTERRGMWRHVTEDAEGRRQTTSDS